MKKRLTDKNTLQLVYGNCSFCENCKISEKDTESGFACKMTTMHSKLYHIENYIDKYCKVINNGISLIQTDNIETIKKAMSLYYLYSVCKVNDKEGFMNLDKFVSDTVCRNYIIDISGIDFHARDIKEILNSTTKIYSNNRGILIFITDNIDNLPKTLMYICNTVIINDKDKYKIIKSPIYENGDIKTINELF